MASKYAERDTDPKYKNSQYHPASEEEVANELVRFTRDNPSAYCDIRRLGNGGFRVVYEQPGGGKEHRQTEVDT